jgi:hypothetical protein
MVFPIVPMSLDLRADHGPLHEGKAQISRGLAVLVRKSPMLLTQSATGFAPTPLPASGRLPPGFRSARLISA